MASDSHISTPSSPENGDRAPGTPPDPSRYRELDIEKTIATIRALQSRISDRFPNSGLWKVCGELLLIASQSKQKIQRIAQPNFWLRIGAGFVVFLSIVTLVVSTSSMGVTFRKIDLAEIIQIFEASINDLVMIGAAFFFLFTIEGRIKRKKALAALHELRSIAHVIDMHQLTKDPSRRAARSTKHSPPHEMSIFELSRYLDYCSEMLSLTGKVSALYAQAFPDPVVLQAINEIEILTSGMSRKVWQKIIILDRMEEAPMNSGLRKGSRDSTDTKS